MGKNKKIEIDEEKKCRHCLRDIHKSATVCYHCGHYQNYFSELITPSTVISFLLLLFTAAQVYLATDAYEKTQDVLIQVENTLNIADMAARMRIGLRTGLIELETFSKVSDNEQSRLRAANLLKRIISDYDSVYTRNSRDMGFKDKAALKGYYNLPANSSDSILVFNILNRINNSDNLDDVAYSFIALRVLSQYPFPMFDFNSVHQWYNTKLVKVK